MKYVWVVVGGGIVDGDYDKRAEGEERGCGSGERVQEPNVRVCCVGSGNVYRVGTLPLLVHQ